MGLFSTSTLHPDLHGDDRLRDLAKAWQDGGAMRLHGVLTPGLAAEAATAFDSIALTSRIFGEQVDLSWSCDVGFLPTPHPERAPCLFRLDRFLQHDLPALVGDITGRSLVTGEASLHLWSMRKGSYVDQGAPLARRGGIDAWLGLTGTPWPASWGGHPVWQSERGSLLTFPPAFDTLDLFDGGSFTIPLVTRHVRTLTVRAFLNPTEESA